METLKFIGGSSAIVDVDFIFGAMRVQPKFKVGVTVTVIMIMMSVHRDSHWPPHARRPNGGKFSLRHRSRMIIKGCAAIIMMGMMMMWRCLAQGLNQAVPPSRASRQRKRQPMVLVRY